MTPRAGALLQAAHRLALDAAAVEAMRELSHRGVDSLLLKGPAVARRLYPDDPGRRPYCDVDLLVAPPAFAATQAALADLGYRPAIEDPRPGDGWWHAQSWFRPGPVRVEIDLHRSFTGVRNHQQFWDASWTTRDELVLGGVPVAVPSAVGAALLLALHAASPGSSPKPRAELELALDAFGPHLWAGAADLARVAGAESAFAVGLALDPRGVDLVRRLGLSTAGTPVEWLRAHSASRSASALADLAAEPSRAARARHVWRRLRPSAAYMRHISPLARRGRVGLRLAYAQRLGDLALGVPRGFRELRQAAESVGAVRSQRSSRWGPFRAAVRAAGHGDGRAVRAGAWALHAWRRCRRQLASGPLRAVAMPPAPVGGATARRAVDGVLRLVGASCLERELVRQEWFRAQGRRRVLVVGVTAPGADFRAHAWLDGESTAEQHGMVEMLRWPAEGPAEGPAGGPVAAGSAASEEAVPVEVGQEGVDVRGGKGFLDRRA